MEFIKRVTILECLATLARPSSVRRPHSNDRRLRCFAGPPWQLSVSGAAAAESAALINTALSAAMLLLPLCCVFIRIGRRRATPREILSTGTDRRDVRRAETAWRREYADRAPPVGETTAALRALGAVRDGDRVASLPRWCDARGAAYSPSAAVAALALAGHATAARARAAAASNVDAVAAALTADGVSPHLAALHAAQRTGALDLHGLDPAEATRAVSLLLDHRDLLTDDVLVITGRGKHSQGGSAVKREVHELLTRRGAVFVEENEGAVRLQTRPVLWLDARRGGQDVASRGVVTVFLADEAAEAAGDVVTLVARAATSSTATAAASAASSTRPPAPRRAPTSKE